MLTVEGTYTSGDREGITVSHEIDFGTMQIKRNYLYKVRIALEDPAGDTYGKVTHAINVKDWTSGVTLAWAGDENLYNNLAAANFTVTGTERKIWDADGVKLEQHLVLPYNAEKSASFYVTSTSTKSGLSLTCPATAVAATAEEGGGYQCTITPQASTYSENGEFTQKWQVTVRESAMLAGNILTFTLQNALNSALSTSFEVIGAPFASEDDIQAGDVYYANGMWSRPADMEDCITYAGTTATGVVAPVAAYESADGDIMLGDDYCAKSYDDIQIGDIIYAAGFWSPGTSAAVTPCKLVSTPVAIVFATNNEITMPAYDIGEGFSHGYALALKEDELGYSWNSANSMASSITNFYTTYPSSGNATQFDTFVSDLSGLEHCNIIKSKISAGTYTTSAFPVYKRVTEFKVAENETALTYLTSGWYVPSIGQLYLLIKYLYNFDGRGNFSNCSPSAPRVGGGPWWSGKGVPFANAVNSLMSVVGEGSYTPMRHGTMGSGDTYGWYWSSTEVLFSGAYYFCLLDLGWTSGSNGNLHLEGNYNSSKMRVRPVLAF